MGSAICNGTPARPLMLWCPYCHGCGRGFPPHTWPKGFDIKTGELERDSGKDCNVFSNSLISSWGQKQAVLVHPRPLSALLIMDKEKEWLSKCPLRKDYLSEYAWLGAKIDWLVDRPKFEYPPEDGD